MLGISSHAIAQGAGTIIRVNAGGPAYVDAAGNTWSADTGYNAGTVFSNSLPISGTNDPTLYTKGRYDNSSASPNLLYAFTVPTGRYEVRLYFAEPTGGPGDRQFHVEVEGARVFTNLDVSNEANGPDKALIKTTTTDVTDGALNIALLYGAAGNPLINAIEIQSSQAPTTPMGITAVAASGTQLNLSWSPSAGIAAIAGYTIERCAGATCVNLSQIGMAIGTAFSDSGLSQLSTYRYRVRSVDLSGNVSGYSDLLAATTTVNTFSTTRVNAGGSAYTDPLGKVWSADNGYSGGSTFTNNPPIANTTTPTLYTTGRYDNSAAAPTLQYGFAIPNGGYEVRLHFAEPSVALGSRQFNVKVEGITVFTNLDVNSEAGGIDTALIKTAAAQVADGRLNLEFLHGAVENPFINAIEILQTTELDTQAPTAPGSFLAVAVSGARVNTSWIGSSDNVGVSGYRVERCDGVTCANFAEIAATSTATYADTTVSPATTYRYRARATDDASNLSSYSNISTVTTRSNADTQAPTPPSGLTALAVSSSEIALSWTSSTDDVGVANYRIERCQGLACLAFVQVGTSSGSTYNDSGLAVGTSYRYRVRAVDAVPNLSPFSSIAGATTLSGGDTQPPTAPASLTATPFSPAQVDLSWSGATDNVGVTGYLVERCVGAGCTNFSQIAVLSVVTSYSDTGLTGGAIYRYRVRARDADSNLGVYSPVASTATASGSGTAGSTMYEYDSFGRLKQVTVAPQ